MADQHDPRAAVIGYGHVGRLFGELLAGAGWQVTAIDSELPQPGSGNGIRDDIGDPTAESRRALADAEVVVVALPERAALTAIDVLDDCVAEQATVVETLSRKARFRAGAERRLAPRPLVSVNPLFHPSLGWAGNTVTGYVVRGGPTATRLLELMRAAGAQVHPLDPDQHDRCVTAVQAVSHAALLGFAAALPELDLPTADVIACAPPPARAMLALASRVLTANPETYWDIQRSGEPGDAARAALRDSLNRLDEQVRAGDDEAFQESFARLRGWLGDDLDRFSGDAAHLLDTLVARRSAASTADEH
ncbi:prephenate dehydrogenase dimerization domain-containing protein [Saccharopolyspora sp. CA-218241]|uniref:prephenate dehydrogenase dimerization domain-containing protein n=1 Tax=Saccharopolyspora sp. CA-218241 TaxID=3240027 RepID=UPI003D99C943